jgi:hypothetical protein
MKFSKPPERKKRMRLSKVQNFWIFFLISLLQDQSLYLAKMFSAKHKSKQENIMLFVIISKNQMANHLKVGSKEMMFLSKLFLKKTTRGRGKTQQLKSFKLLIKKIWSLL